MHLSAFLTTVVLTTLVAGHPGHDHSKELSARMEFLANNKNDLSHCAEMMKARGLHANNVRRRSELAEGLMRKRGLESKTIGFSHNDTSRY